MKWEASGLALPEGNRVLPRESAPNGAQTCYQELYAVFSNGETLSDADFTSVIP